MSIKVLSIGSDRKLFEEGSAVLERIKEYGKLVEELHIIVFTTKEHARSLKIKNSKLEVSNNIWIYPTNSFSRWFYIRDAARLGKAIVFDRKFVRGKSVITTQDPFECGRAGLKVKKKWRLPLEVQLHTDPFSPYFSGFLNMIRKFVAKKVLENADGIRVVSEDLKSVISSKFHLNQANIYVLPIYIDKDAIENSRITFDLHARFGWHFILLSVARLTAEKNFGLALEVLARVREKFPKTGLVIVGSGPEEGRLKALARKLNVNNAVEFAGWQTDLASYYKTANAYIQTSLFEGYGMSLVEAGLSGLPIITTAVGIARELESGKDAYVFPVESPDLFIQGIVDLIENNSRRESLRANLRHTLEAKLLSKTDYMTKIKDNWEKLSGIIKL